jgi:hypothetical protein
MHRSAVVQISLVAVMAAAVQSCQSGKPSIVEHCVDQNGNVVDDEKCSTPASGSTSPNYRYWYGGYTPVGGHVSGGSYTPPSSGGSTPRASVARGGFGSVGAGHGSGEGS